MLSAVLGFLDATGKRIATKIAGSSQYLPAWLKLGTGLTGSAARNGPDDVITLAVDVEDLPVASASQVGVLSASDFATFATSGGSSWLTYSGGTGYATVAVTEALGALQLYGGYDSGTGAHGNVDIGGGSTVRLSALDAGGSAELIGNASGRAYLSGGGVTFTLQNGGAALSKFLDFAPMTAPAAPASGWRIYCDTATGKLRAVHSTGTRVDLAVP